MLATAQFPVLTVSWLCTWTLGATQVKGCPVSWRNESNDHSSSLLFTGCIGSYSTRLTLWADALWLHVLESPALTLRGWVSWKLDRTTCLQKEIKWKQGSVTDYVFLCTSDVGFGTWDTSVTFITKPTAWQMAAILVTIVWCLRFALTIELSSDYCFFYRIWQEMFGKHPANDLTMYHFKRVWAVLPYINSLQTSLPSSTRKLS